MRHHNHILLLGVLLLFGPLAETAEIIETPVTCTIAPSSFDRCAQEAKDWCGAATIRTILENYPATPCMGKEQTDVADKLALPQFQGQGFFTADPDGVAGVLNQAGSLFSCPPSTAHWVVFSNDSASALMYSMAFYMKRFKYPVAALYRTSAHNDLDSHREHWVTVYRLDVGNDPFTSQDIALDKVHYISQVESTDPTQPPQSVVNVVDAALWLADFQKISIPTATYDGKYVAVIEPPRTPGKVRVVPFAVTGRPISTDSALAAARRFARSMETNPQFRELTTLQARRPLLVNPERGGYYVVPFSRGDSAPTAAVIVNAYNGRFMKAGRFQARPMQTQDQAVRRALTYLGRGSARQVQTSLVATVADGTTYFPAWRVVADGQEVMVEQDGRIRPTGRPVQSCGNLQKTIATGNPSGWTLVSGPGINRMQPVVVTPMPTAWSSVPNARWVSVDARGGSRAGAYEYEAEFCLCGEARNPRLTLTFLADNGARVLLNGKQIFATTGNMNFRSPLKSVGYAGTRSDWVIGGTNKVRVIVDNESSITGLTATLEVRADSGACPGN